MNQQIKQKKNLSFYVIIILTVITIIVISMIILFQYGAISDKAVITDYSVTTTYSTQECIKEAINVITHETTCIVWGPKYHSVPGFYKNLPDDADNIGYKVTFNVGNKAGQYLDVIGIKVIFCDANDNELCSELTSVYDVPNSYAKRSSVTIYETSTNFFNIIEKVRFEVIID